MNPFLVRDKLPDFNTIKSQHVIPAINRVITDNRKSILKIESIKELPNWNNFIIPLEKCNEKLGRVWSYINHINSVRSSASYRKAYNQALAMITEYFSDLGQSHILYSKYKKLLKNNLNLTEAQKKLVKNEIISFELSGVALPKKKR